MDMSERFSQALTYAEALHREQTRKGSGSPYVGHLLGVASLVMESGGSEDECIAALLHDAVEDQGGPPRAAEIRQIFGGPVADIVDACSEDKSEGADWRSRKLAAVRRTRTAGPSARLVLAADKLHNCRSLIAALNTRGERTWDQFNGSRSGIVWYYRAMANAIGEAGGCALHAELENAVCSLEELAGGQIER